MRPLLPACGAPTTTSARPSPLTSPAPATAAPALSSAAAPSMRKPAPPSAARSMAAAWPVPKTTCAEPEPVRPLLPACGAPTTTSARPSPLTSPAPATAAPALSSAAAPSMRKPAPPSAARSISEVSRRPNTTCAEPGAGAGVVAGLRRAHHHVGAPVAVDVPRAGRPPRRRCRAPPRRRCGSPPPRAPPGRWRRPRLCRRRRAPSRSRGGVVAGPRRAHHHVGAPVAVDVPRAGHRRAGVVERRRAVDAEAGAPEPARSIAEVSRRPNTTKAVPGAAPVRVGLRSTEHDVGEAVAVDVAGAPDGRPEPVAVGRAVDAKPARADLGEVDRRRRLGAEDHIGRSRAAAAPCGLLRGADDHIAAPVAVDIPRAGHGGACPAAADRAIDTKLHVRHGDRHDLPAAGGRPGRRRSPRRRRAAPEPRPRSGRARGPRAVYGRSGWAHARSAASIRPPRTARRRGRRACPLAHRRRRRSGARRLRGRDQGHRRTVARRTALRGAGPVPGPASAREAKRTVAVASTRPRNPPR